MKKGFTLVELIISISLIVGVGALVLVLFNNIKPTYADSYENLRNVIADATNVYLNTVGSSDKEKLNKDKYITLNSNVLIENGLLPESYFVENLGENIDVYNIEINVYQMEDGLLNYSINIKNIQ